MKSRHTFLAIVGATLVAIAGTALAQSTIGPAAPTRPAGAPAQSQKLESALALKPHQRDAWSAYEARIRARTAEEAKLREQMLQGKNDSKATAAFEAELKKRRAKSDPEIQALRNALVAKLDPEQRVTLERFRPDAAQVAGKTQRQRG
jgi:hypothetical protein